MSAPMAFFGLEVPAGDVAIPARPDIPAAFRITMAAIDPTAEPEESDVAGSSKPRATLTLIRQPLLADFLDEDDESDFDEDEMEALLAEEDSDLEDEESEADEAGPSDPSKSKKARKAAAAAQIMKELEGAMEVDAPNGVNGKAKGKGKAEVEDEEEDDEEEDSEEDSDDDFDELDEPEEFVICTLDPERIYQQPIDITIGRDERVWFKVSGTHSIHLTGNYVETEELEEYDSEEDYDSEDEDEYDLTPDEDELDEEDISEDDLDDLEDPRIMEVESEEEAPALVKADKKKGKNKRAAEDSEADVTLDDLISKAQDANPDKSKKAKKIKTNEGKAVAAPKEESKDKKSVQFAEKLESGPTPSAPKTANPRVVNGVTIDIRKAGEGEIAKKGDRVSMRYIGKLQKDGKVFDSNKKGKPFSFKLGVGEVIKGWDVGVAGMRVGSEARLTIPAHAGYGSKGAPGIPGNSTLIFDVKLLEIKKN